MIASGSETRGGTGRRQGCGRRSAALAALLLLGGLAGPAAAQPDEPSLEGAPTRRVEIAGLSSVSEAYVRRVIKTREGQPFQRRQLEEDVRELLRTRKFLNAFATTALEEGQVVVRFAVQEKPTITTVELEGNKKFTDVQLFELTPRSGEVLDLYVVNKAREDILQKYKAAGYFYAQVLIDERAFETEARVIYRINEGPRVKVRKIVFEGNRSFPDIRLKSRLQTKTYVWIFRTGALDEAQADRDAIELQQFYRGEGFLDARVGYRLEFDEVSRADLTVVFVIEEGVRYRVQEIVFEGNTVFDGDSLRARMRLAPGDWLREEWLTEDRKRIQDAYGEIGYVDAQIDTRIDFTDVPGQAILRLRLTERTPSRFGLITIRGNQITRDEVIRRELRFYPGEEWNTVKAREAEQRLRETGLFQQGAVKVTPLEDIDGLREALVEVEEGETVTFLIGVGVSTDNGVIGSLTIENRNFDLFDWPRTWGQFFRGQAFRGDGQRLRLSLEPGTEVSRFRIDFTEPYLFDKPLRMDTSVYLFQRGRDGYDEQRLGFIFGLSKRFESGLLENWAIEGGLRVEGVDIDDVDALAAREIRDAEGNHFLTALRGTIAKDTTDSRVLPSEGYRVAFSWEQVGALGGDYSFGKPSISAAWYKTVREDIFDRKSILAVRADAAYIVGEAPVFERYYGGGFGSLRGFRYRGISPRNGVFDNAVGGDFIVLTGAEYSVPLYAKNIRGVTFLDMGTVEEDFGISGWRASVGLGLRIQVDFFGPVPIVLDFGFPVASEDGDEEQVFNFAFGASF